MPFFQLPPTGSITPDWLKAMRLQLERDDDEDEQKIRMGVERRFEREMRAALDDMLNTLFPETYGDFVDPQLEANRIHQAFLRDQNLQDTISRAIQDSADLGVSVAVQQLEGVGFGFDWTLANLNARNWANRHTTALLEQLGVVSGRVAGQTIGRWINNGESFPKLIKDLEPVFGRRRSELIAATEVTRAYAQGTVEGYRESGLVRKLIWQAVFDERVCPFCGGLHNRVVGIDQSFDSKLPADLQGKIKPFALPPAHPGCRCFVIAEIEEPKRRR
jgi:SPP1 gp7 family putative phage head morphogenesis protein